MSQLSCVCDTGVEGVAWDGDGSMVWDGVSGHLELISPDCQAHVIAPLSQTAGVDTQEQ